MTFIESIEHLLSLAKAENDGKTIQDCYRTSKVWQQIPSTSTVRGLTESILAYPDCYRIAPEPREHWSVFTAEGVYSESVFHESHAKDIAARINGTYAKFIEAL